MGEMVSVEKVTTVVECVEVGVVAVKVEVSTLTAEVRGGGSWCGTRRDGGGVDKGY